MTRIICFLIGHKWRPFNMAFTTVQGVDYCTRCEDATRINA